MVRSRARRNLLSTLARLEFEVITPGITRIYDILLDYKEALMETDRRASAFLYGLQD